MTKQLYTVTVETEIVVIAEDEEEACDFAEQEVRMLDFETRASAMRFYPSGWNGDTIPFGEGDDEDPDRTVDQWVALGAAPMMKTRAKATAPPKEGTE